MKFNQRQGDEARIRGKEEISKKNNEAFINKEKEKQATKDNKFKQRNNKNH